MNKTQIEVVSYDPNWPAQFEKEKRLISDVLGENCIAIHHVGSTSVPGLCAKPKIDLIVVAKDRTKAISALPKIGYEYRGEWNIPLQVGFSKKAEICANLHMFFDADHPEIALNLAFRNYLREHADVRDEYAAIKRKILEDETAQERVGKMNFPVYTLRKRKFIDEVLKKIGFNRLRVVKCLTEEEQNYARIFQKETNSAGTFDDENHEHFILYRGVEIIGYADIDIAENFDYKFDIDEANGSEDRTAINFFDKVIKEWIQIKKMES